MNKNKIIALTITASILLGSTVSAQSLNNEGSLKAVPISVVDINQNTAMRAYIFDRSVNEENEQVKVDIKLPLILGMKDWKYQMQLNNILKSQAMKDKLTVEEEAKNLAEASKQYGWPLRKTELDIKYEVKNNSDVLSFIITTYMYLGGANGTTRVDTYNVALKEDKNISLSDLFKDETDFKTAINNEISTQIESETGEGKLFFKDDMGFKTISDKQNYYIQDDNLIILFQKYEIAPGAMGTPEFKIPLKNLNHILKPGYVKDDQSQNEKKQIAFNSFTGTVKEIKDLQAESGRKLVSVESDLGEKATIVISNDTYVVNNAQIAEGAVITGFYDATAPMIMIYPPQYSAEVVTVVEKGQNIKVDRFDENLLSSDLWLKLNISKDTEIITEDGKGFNGNLKNRDLIVFYGATTKSIPPQTTPTKIIVLSEKHNNK